MQTQYEYEVYIPTVNEEGDAYPASLLESYKALLVERFGGVTDFRHRSEGLWRVGNTTFRDEIVLYRVLSDDRARARNELRSLQERMRRELKQKEVLVIERQVMSL
ncbi:MAG TPA: hypothetical protein VK524_18475 [Polyangiaceae bacterium]|nr:hypothetical protein [Polyangiaceae bacterium]